MHGYDIAKDVAGRRHGALQLPGRARGRVRGRARGPQGADRGAEGQALMTTQLGRRGVAAVAVAALAVPAAGGRARARRPRRPADPGVAVRLGRRGRADRLVRGARDCCGRRPSSRATSASARCPTGCRSRSSTPPRRSSPGSSASACSAHDLGRPRRACSRRRPNFAPTFIYVIFWVGLVPAQHPVRRRLPGLQPVAGDRARRRLRRVARRRAAAGAVPLSREWLGRWPAAVDASRLRLDGARLHQRQRPEHARDRGAGLQRDHPARRSRASAPRPGSRAARRSRSTSTCSRGSRRSR